MQRQIKHKQQGLSLVGLIFVLAILGGLAMIGLQVVPTVTEYMAIKNAVAKAKNAGSTPNEIRNSFDLQANTAYITSITGKDLELTRGDNGFDVSFAYEKRIPLAGPVNLLIDYAGTTEQAKRPLRNEAN